MILTADSEVARQTTRRKTGNGWLTTFIGQNRNTLKPGEAAPDPSMLYPMAFLVEKEPGAVVKPHFHQADQFQVVVQGGGRLGVHDVGTVAVHYTDAWSAYGPIVAADDGIAWFTLRNTWDSGARYMPAARDQLRAARAQQFQHREATVAPTPALAEAELARTGQLSCIPVLQQGEDGLATWRYRMPPTASATGPDPSLGGGQFWIVLSGSASAGDSTLLPPNSCVFVSPDSAPLQIAAGALGAEAMCLQFPLLARH
jgi:hypothetical protein